MTLTIGPAFISASIYLCLARIIVVYGENLSRFRPATYTITFIACDFLSLLLQAAGGAIASGANTYQADQNGIHIMVAGLSFQVASLALFMVFCAEFAWRVYRHRGQTESSNSQLRHSIMFRGFLFCKFISSASSFPSMVSVLIPSSLGTSNPLHLRSIHLPCRGTECRIPWQTRQPTNHFHDSRGCYDHHCNRLTHHLPSWALLRWTVGSGGLHFEEEKG